MRQIDNLTRKYIPYHFTVISAMYSVVSNMYMLQTNLQPLARFKMVQQYFVHYACITCVH